jgi:RNA polymerase sporulation-specific sigma factor
MTIVQDRINIVDARNNEFLKEEFFKQNIKLVYKVASNLRNIFISQDEKISIGSFGLVKAFNTYDVESGYAFSTYAMRVIANEILMVNRENRKVKPLSLDGVAAKDKDDKELLLIDTLAAEEGDFDKGDFAITKEVYKKFTEIYSEKDPKLLQVFNLYILEDKTTGDIGKIVGHTQAHVSRLAAKAVKSIQEIAIEMEVIEGFNRYGKRGAESKAKKIKNSNINTKRRALYIAINYPELTSREIAEILKWTAMSVSRVILSHKKGTFNLTPDESIEPKVQEYLANKKIYN